MIIATVILGYLAFSLITTWIHAEQDAPSEFFLILQLIGAGFFGLLYLVLIS